MKKLKSLRHALLAAPLGPRGGRLSSETLLTFAEKGAVRFYDGGPSASFEIEYEAHVIAVGFAGDPLRLLGVVCRWLATECPGTPIDAVKFHVDIIDSVADVSILVPLREDATDTGDGIVATDDPPRVDELGAAFLGLTDG